ncbi:MAG: Ppx/GppA family phosphatase, partial [Aquificae bacterium]|nr:Ppx/GppA family phosphatase [Aquificota bacterium]
MRAAAIDVGSYSVRLSVGELQDGRLTILHEEGTITALGSGVKETGLLREDRVEETLRVLKRFADKARRLGAGRIEAVATEALRRARNAPEFLRRAEEETGIKVRVISPEEEGFLAYRGAVYELPVKGKVLAVDQGGGSTELVTGVEREPRRVRSLPFGIVSLTEGFLKSDPPTE